MNDMNNNNITANFRSLVNEMIAERRAYAAANGFTVTDDEIADHVAVRLAMMMCEAAKA
jgi:hypothetical protein